MCFCFTGFPAPVYKWYKDGKEVGDFSSEYQSFRLLNLKHDDGGTYQCIAKNEVGSILSQKIEINIACKLNLFSISTSSCYYFIIFKWFLF